MPSHSWNGHAFKVRCLAAPRSMSVELWVQTDGRPAELTEARITPSEIVRLAGLYPGEPWLPLAQLPFNTWERDAIVPSRVELDLSVYDARKFRYRIFVGDEQAVTAETRAQTSGTWLVYVLVVAAVYVLFMGALWIRH